VPTVSDSIKEVIVKSLKILFITLTALLLIPSIVSAGDFDWMRDFNLRAQADPSGLRARLETRFQIGDAKIKLVLGNVDSPADAYMLLRLGEMSHQPLNHVLETYRVQKGKGWGALAKSLGIKPGSADFHALKRGQDLYHAKNEADRAEDGGKGKGKRRK